MGCTEQQIKSKVLAKIEQGNGDVSGYNQELTATKLKSRLKDMEKRGIIKNEKGQ